MSGAIRHCAIIGGGVIGGGWAARFLSAGLDVTVFDPHPEAERRLREMVALGSRALRKLVAAPLPPEGRLRFVGNLAEAVATAGPHPGKRARGRGREAAHPGRDRRPCEA